MGYLGIQPVRHLFAVRLDNTRGQIFYSDSDKRLTGNLAKAQLFTEVNALKRLRDYLLDLQTYVENSQTSGKRDKAHIQQLIDEVSADIRQVRATGQRRGR